MPLELTPLATLPPAVDKVAGEKAPPPLRMMAARGLSPLKPGELCTALYQLHLSDEAEVKQAALKTALGLPPNLLRGGLAEPLDARVLDFFARRVWQKPELLEVVLLNRATADETYCHLAGLCGENELEMLSKNEERMLRHPAIIAALYMNPKTRMSTAQRALELAVRNGVRVDGIPAFDEAVEALAGEPIDEKVDEAFKQAAQVTVEQTGGLLVNAVDPNEAQAMEAETAERAEQAASGLETGQADGETVEKKKRLDELPISAQVRIASLGNAVARSVLIRSTNKQVALACIKAPSVSDSEVLHYAANRALDEEVIRFIANRRQWTRLYGVKVNLCNNPKTPLPVSMGFLSHLRVPDLKALARSKGIPSALANAAKQMVSVRSGG